MARNTGDGSMDGGAAFDPFDEIDQIGNGIVPAPNSSASEFFSCQQQIFQHQHNVAYEPNIDITQNSNEYDSMRDEP